MTADKIREQIQRHRAQIVILEAWLTSALKNPLCIVEIKTAGGRLIEERECLYEDVQDKVTSLMDAMSLTETNFYGYPLPPGDADAPAWWDDDAPIPVFLGDEPHTILTAVNGYAFGPIYHFTVRLA